MAQPEAAPDMAPKKKSKLPLIIGLVLALVLGGAGFYAVSSGMILGATEGHATSAEGEHPAKAEGEAGGEGGGEAHGEGDGEGEAGVAITPIGDIAFVPLTPLVISLGAATEAHHLRFSAQIEASAAHAEEVALLQPRILDVLNSYLRAVEVAELEDPTALLRIRAQMLRRIQIVTGEGRVRDLLITEFVLN